MEACRDATGIIHRLESMSSSSRARYGIVWGRWYDWCITHHADSRSPTEAEIAAHLLCLIEPCARCRHDRVGVSTAALHRSALRVILPGGRELFGSVEADAAWQAARRASGRPPRRVRAMTPDEIVAMCDAAPDSAEGARDAAILSIGFAAALRGAEIIALDVDDLEILDDERALVHVRRSKTDPYGYGSRVPIIDGQRVHAVMRAQMWLEARPAADSPALFLPGPRGRMTRLSRPALWRVMRRAAVRADVRLHRLSTHSLRAGFITAAARAGVPWHRIAQVSRHRSASSLMRYIRDATRWADHPGEDVL